MIFNKLLLKRDDSTGASPYWPAYWLKTFFKNHKHILITNMSPFTEYATSISDSLVPHFPLLLSGKDKNLFITRFRDILPPFYYDHVITYIGSDDIDYIKMLAEGASIKVPGNINLGIKLDSGTYYFRWINSNVLGISSSPWKPIAQFADSELLSMNGNLINFIPHTVVNSARFSFKLVRPIDFSRYLTVPTNPLNSSEEGMNGRFITALEDINIGVLFSDVQNYIKLKGALGTQLSTSALSVSDQNGTIVPCKFSLVSYNASLTSSNFINPTEKVSEPAYIKMAMSTPNPLAWITSILNPVEYELTVMKYNAYMANPLLSYTRSQRLSVTELPIWNPGVIVEAK